MGGYYSGEGGEEGTDEDFLVQQVSKEQAEEQAEEQEEQEEQE